jgi:hypothetical protein
MQIFMATLYDGCNSSVCSFFLERSLTYHKNDKCVCGMTRLGLNTLQCYFSIKCVFYAVESSESSRERFKVNFKM